MNAFFSLACANQIASLSDGTNTTVLSGMHMRRVIIPALTVTLVAAVIFVACSIRSSNRIESGSRVESVSWLPAEATDVSFYRSYGWTAFEFTIEEQGFRHWASAYLLEEIDEPVHMERWSWATFSQQGSDLSFEDFQRLQSAHITSIENGLIGGTSSDNGGKEIVAFDRAKSRGYFQANRR